MQPHRTEPPEPRPGIPGPRCKIFTPHAKHAVKACAKEWKTPCFAAPPSDHPTPQRSDQVRSVAPGKVPGCSTRATSVTNQRGSPCALQSAARLLLALHPPTTLAYPLHVLTRLARGGATASFQRTRPDPSPIGRDAYHQTCFTRWVCRDGSKHHGHHLSAPDTTGRTLRRQIRSWPHKTLPLFHRLPLILVLWGVQRTTGSLLI